MSTILSVNLSSLVMHYSLNSFHSHGGVDEQSWRSRWHKCLPKGNVMKQMQVEKGGVGD